jgi:hypothetical protein
MLVPMYFDALRYPASLYEPDMRIARIRLSDKNSRLHPRHVMPKRGQAYEPEVPVKVRERIDRPGRSCSSVDRRAARSFPNECPLI